MVTVEYFDSKEKEIKTIQAEEVLFGDKKAAVIISTEPYHLIDIPFYYLYSIK